MDTPLAHYQVKTDAFQGPLDLLLTLIEKRKLHVSDIALAQVADDYIAYTKQLEHFPIGETAGFILVAATLLLIKSKSLLPTLSLSLEEQADVSDLERRLKMYQCIKEASRHVRERFGAEPLFFRDNTGTQIPVFAPSGDLSVKTLAEAALMLIKNLPKAVSALSQKVIKKVVSLEEMINRLTERIQMNIKMSFKEFSGAGKKEKVHVIVSFLAMLELVKQGVLSVAQEKQFHDIQMETHTVHTPRYL